MVPSLGVLVGNDATGATPVEVVGNPLLVVPPTVFTGDPAVAPDPPRLEDPPAVVPGAAPAVNRAGSFPWGTPCTPNNRQHALTRTWIEITFMVHNKIKSSKVFYFAIHLTETANCIL